MTQNQPTEQAEGPAKASAAAVPPRVAAALEQFPGSIHVELTMGYPARDESGTIVDYFRHVVVRPSTLDDEIKRDVMLLRIARAEMAKAEKAGGSSSNITLSDALLEVQSSAMSVAALLLQVIVAFDDVPRVTLDHLRALTRTDVGMIQDALETAEAELVRIYEGKR